MERPQVNNNGSATVMLGLEGWPCWRYPKAMVSSSTPSRPPRRPGGARYEAVYHVWLRRARKGADAGGGSSKQLSNWTGVCRRFRGEKWATRPT